MIWIILLLGAGLFAWFLLAPRRFQTLENIPTYVDEKLKTHSIVETTEDPQEVRPIVQRAASRAGDTPAPGHGDSLTFDWPSDHMENHVPQEHREQAPPEQRA